MSKKKSIPKELLTKRDVIECNFIFSLYNNPDRINEFKNIENGKDIITEDGILYYGILENMVKAGFKTIDHSSIYDYLADKKALMEGFERRGGWKTVQDITSLLSNDNMDAYYDDLCKNNMLIRFNEAGFNVLDNLDKFNQMDMEQVYSFYEYQLANIAIGKIEKLKAEDLTTNYDEWIAKWDEGGGTGYPISSKMLNFQLLGIHKQALMLHMASIGTGKTTSAIHWYILPAIETQDVVIIANEQSVSEWRQMILSTVLFNKIGFVEGFSRHKMMVGHYEPEQIVKMKEAAMWLDSQPGKIIFIETQDYSVNNIKKIVAKYSALGCSLFVTDTLKPMNDASDKAWAEFSEVAKELYLLSKKYDVAMIATCQLSPEAMSRRYLDLTCIAKAKAIAETASAVVMFRPITADEKDKIKPYKYDGKIKIKIDLDPDKDYIMVFTPKNRFGQVTPQIIMERNMNFNTYKDVGWYECSYDQFRTK